MALVYIPPIAAPAGSTGDIINYIVARQQAQNPSAFMEISRDFNYASLSATLPKFLICQLPHQRKKKKTN